MSKYQYASSGKTAGVFRHRLFARQTTPRRARPLLFIATLTIAAARVSAIPPPAWFQPSVLWSGSYRQTEEEGGFLNRGDARLRLNPAPLLDFTVRAQMLDERPLNAGAGGVSVFGAGLYHNPTGSRILYGPLNASGLPARVKNIYRHGAPFFASHTPSSVELKTDPGADGAHSLAIRLVSPELFGWRAFTTLLEEKDDNRAGFLFGMTTAGGAQTPSKNRIQAAAEFYAQNAALPERRATGWFPDKRPLPERETRLYAGTARILSPIASVAADIAYSETFAFGRGVYWNAGLQFGNRPWRISLAADMTTPFFVDGAGAVPGPGFRVGGKLERFLPRGGLWRAETTLRGYDEDENAFTRSASTLYYRFSAPERAKAAATPVSLSYVSLGAARNATNRAKILDTWNAALAFNAGKARFKTAGALGEYTSDNEPSPFPDRANVYTVSHWQLDGEMTVPFDLFTLTAAASWVMKRDTATALWKDAEVPLSLSAQFRLTQGSLAVKLAFSDFPAGWNLRVSWRLRAWPVGQ